MPLWLPKGATIRRLLEEYILKLEREDGYDHVYSPALAKVDLYGRETATCLPHSYPSDTAFAYQWLRNGKLTSRALGRRRVLGDADVGTRLACRLTATGPGGSQTVTSPGTRPVLAQLAVDTTSVSGSTITATVTLSRGRLRATALASPALARGSPCGP